MEFPRLVFKATKGKEFKHESVENIEQYDAKLADGWHGSVPEAIAVLPVGSGAVGAPSAGDGKGSNVLPGNDNNEQPTRAEMETMAKKLNIKGNISGMKDKTLLAKIDEALAKQKE